MFQIGDIIYTETTIYEFAVVENITKKGNLTVRIMRPDYNEKFDCMVEQKELQKIKLIRNDGSFMKDNKKMYYQKFNPNNNNQFTNISNILYEYRYYLIGSFLLLKLL